MIGRPVVSFMAVALGRLSSGVELGRLERWAARRLSRCLGLAAEPAHSAERRPVPEQQGLSLPACVPDARPQTAH